MRPMLQGGPASPLQVSWYPNEAYRELSNTRATTEGHGNVELLTDLVFENNFEDGEAKLPVCSSANPVGACEVSFTKDGDMSRKAHVHSSSLEATENSGSSGGNESSPGSIVKVVVEKLLEEARSAARTSKVELRNALKEELASRKGSLSLRERRILRSRREAAVAKQNRIVYTLKLEETVRALVKRNLEHQLQTFVNSECLGEQL